jgi:molybdopterin-synthase adenylyltransferase
LSAHRQIFGAAFTNELDNELQKFLIRADREEDLLFALWSPSRGTKRLTALVHTILYPQDGDRQRHGNVSFNPQYFERACSEAMTAQSGIAFLHSHPGPGWQGMSEDDVIAETKIAGSTESLTELPLVGMTVGDDGTWSARVWCHHSGKHFARHWCEAVRSVGQRLRTNFADEIVPPPRFRELFKRTATVWGEANHRNLARLRIGIIGLGSVGSIVAETLARMGMTRFVLIDFDEVQIHNLDRLLGATVNDIGKLKIAVAARQIKGSSTASSVTVAEVPHSVAEERGYTAALDCDIIFCCVDRPRARKILNHFAYAHLIPVVDGGIDVRFKHGEFAGVDWPLQIAAPTRPCLECIGTFTTDDASTEEAGMLDDPSYVTGLPPDHRFKRNENVFPFSANLASLEVLQFVEFATGIGGINNFGIQRYRYNVGHVDCDVERTCKSSCDIKEFIAEGDRYFTLQGRDLGAEAARERQRAYAESSRQAPTAHRLPAWLGRFLARMSSW